MEYIQCTHCGKRYAVNEQIRAAEGQFTTCKSCDEKFLIAIHSGEKNKAKDDEQVVSTGSWDPSLTMPEENAGRTDDVSVEDYLGDAEDDAEEVLAILQAKRKKQRLMYAGGGVLVVLLGVGIWFWLHASGEQAAVTPSTRPAQQKAQLSPRELDMRNDACRHAAALQWLLDSKAMTGQYDGKAFVRLIKSSEKQSDEVRKHCKNPEILRELIAAATRQKQPDWLKDDIAIVTNHR